MPNTDPFLNKKITTEITKPSGKEKIEATWQVYIASSKIRYVIDQSNCLLLREDMLYKSLTNCVIEESTGFYFKSTVPGGI